METVYSFLFQAHSIWRWVVLIMIIFTTVKMVVGWIGKQEWAAFDAKLVSYTHMVVAIQVLLGVVLYILFLLLGGLGRSVMGFTGGHAVPAILGYAGVAFASVRSKRMNTSRDKFKFAAIGLLIAIILIYGALQTVGGLFA